jgi:hypothetical protein
MALSPPPRFITPRILSLVVACLIVAGGYLGLATSALAIAYDFTTFSVDRFPAAGPVSTFPSAVWNVTATTATHNSNANATILYSPTSALNKTITGSLRPGSDDDVVGFVLGYQPGDAVSGTSSKYLLIDWKGSSQVYDFDDLSGAEFHGSTPGGNMPVGLALSEVTGLPTNDELWQHVNLPQNNSGGVTQLARGATLGSTAYNRSGGTHQFEITYTATNVKVVVDGVEQFNINGSFPDGRFGLYSAWQGPTPQFSNFEVEDLGFEDLRAVVDRATGVITLTNPGTIPLNFDYYQLSSPSHSLTPNTWDSLSHQNFQPSGSGVHQKWQEMGGSDSLIIAEVRLSSHSTLAPNGEQAIGLAYNNAINGEDLVLEYREPGGQVRQGTVVYVGVAPPDLPGDFNNDGVVDASDYVVWRNNLGADAWVLNGNGDNSPTVDEGDYELWKNNFGATAPAALGLSTTKVPEPATLLLTGAITLLAGIRFGGRYLGQRA